MSDPAAQGGPDRLATAPLAGIRVIEFAQNAAVPHCGRILAGLGADVVKVEPPAGDAMRSANHFGPGEAKAYAAINPGKRSMIVDLTHDSAPQVVAALLRWADVSLVAFKGSDLERFGLDWASAQAVNDRLIHLIHLPFGAQGEYADQGGYDVLVQALSGMGFLMNRVTDQGLPMASRPAVNDFATGIAGALGVVTALRHRDLTGQGQRVDASLLATAMSLSTAVIHHFEASDPPVVAELQAEFEQLRAAGVGFDDQRQIFESRLLQGHGAFRLYFRYYRTSDGLISVAGLSPGLRGRFHAATGVDPPATLDVTDPDYQRCVDETETVFGADSSDHWLDRLRSHGYPCSRYNLPFEAIDDPQIRANDFVVDLDHPTIGRYTTANMPVGFSDLSSAVTAPSPGLGVDTVEVLEEAGLAADAIAGLVAAGAVIDHPAPEIDGPTDPPGARN